MNFNFSFFLSALGLAVVMEAMPWLISPERMRETIARLAELPPERLRRSGIILLAAGLLICAAGRSIR